MGSSNNVTVRASAALICCLFFLFSLCAQRASAVGSLTDVHLDLSRQAGVQAGSTLGMGYEPDAARDGSLCTHWVGELDPLEGTSLTYTFDEPLPVAGIEIILGPAVGAPTARENLQYWVETRGAGDAAPDVAHYLHGAVRDVSSFRELYTSPRMLREVRLRFPAEQNPPLGENERVHVARFAVLGVDPAPAVIAPETRPHQFALAADERFQAALAAERASYYNTDWPAGLYQQIIDATETTRTVRAHALLHYSMMDSRRNLTNPDLRDAQLDLLRSVVDDYPDEHDAVALAWCRIGEAHVLGHRWDEAEPALSHVVTNFGETEAAWWARLSMIDLYWWQQQETRALVAVDEIRRGYRDGLANATQYGWALFKEAHILDGPAPDGDALSDPQRTRLLDIWEELKYVPGAEEPAAMAKHKVATVEQYKGHWPWALAHFQDLYDEMPFLPGWSSNGLVQMIFILREMQEYDEARRLITLLESDYPNAPEARMVPVLRGLISIADEAYMEGLTRSQLMSRMQYLWSPRREN